MGCLLSRQTLIIERSGSYISNLRVCDPHGSRYHTSLISIDEGKRTIRVVRGDNTQGNTQINITHDELHEDQKNKEMIHESFSI